MKHIIDRNNVRLSYTDTFIDNGKLNFIDDLDWNILETDLIPNPNFYKTFWSGSEWVEGATQEEIQQKYILEAKQNETELYKKRQIDGVNAYAEISAEFRLAKLSGMLSEEQHGAIESVLIPVRNEVLAGQWISARNILEEIGTSIGSELYDRLHNQITNYINDNY